MSNKLEKVSSNKVSTGTLTKYSFESSSLSLKTQFNIFIPSSASKGAVPVLFYSAGLTCNEDTGAQKGGFLNKAGEEGIAVVFPDTSPRGAGVEGEDDDWDFGTGAGFYLNATSPKWKKNYNMYDLIVEELPKVLEEADLSLDLTRMSIFGHSMGGHGALSIYLKNLGKYKSASAFSPAANPSKTPWGIKAFSNYLSSPTPSSSSNDEPPSEWLEYDSSYLLSKIDSKEETNILIDVGTQDDFLKKGQLEPESISKQERKGVDVRLQDGFDHSYYFISTFAPEHVAYHAKFLKA